MKALVLLLLLAAWPNLLRAEDVLTAEIRRMAEQGDPEAQFSLGLRLDLGEGMERNPEQAALWFGKAAEGGIVGAFLYLGMKHEVGAGVKQDKAAASVWYERAALRGWPQAAFLLGSLCLSLPEPEKVRGCAWLGIAADQGYPGAEEARQQGCSSLNSEAKQAAAALARQLARRMNSSSD